MNPYSGRDTTRRANFPKGIRKLGLGASNLWYSGNMLATTMEWHYLSVYCAQHGRPKIRIKIVDGPGLIVVAMILVPTGRQEIQEGLLVVFLGLTVIE